jgi:murein DD-endopeptidase MepM/ murein hydrolase activator NlpD
VPSKTPRPAAHKAGRTARPRLRLGQLGIIGHRHTDPNHPKRRKSSKRAAAGFLSLTVGGAAFALAMIVSLHNPAGGDRAEASQTALLTPPPPLHVALIDVDQDGTPDFANPTMGPLRGEDSYGSGSFGATRDGGHRVHDGADYVAAPNTIVYSPISGEVTKLGYAYAKNTALRFVEITNSVSSLVSRVLYVDPSVKPGDVLKAGDPIGVAEDLSKRYRGITNHVHVQIAVGRNWLDPASLLPSAQSITTADAAAGASPGVTAVRVSGTLPAQPL